LKSILSALIVKKTLFSTKMLVSWSGHPLNTMVKTLSEGKHSDNLAKKVVF